MSIELFLWSLVVVYMAATSERRASKVNFRNRLVQLTFVLDNNKFIQFVPGLLRAAADTVRAIFMMQANALATQESLSSLDCALPDGVDDVTVTADYLHSVTIQPSEIRCVVVKKKNIDIYIYIYTYYIYIYTYL